MFSLPPLFGDKPTVFEYGKILTAIVNFFLVSLAIYLFIIIPMNKLTASLKKEEAEAPPAQPSEEILLLREIRDSLAIRRAVANKAALGRVYNWTTPTPAGRSPQRGRGGDPLEKGSRLFQGNPGWGWAILLAR